MITIAWKKRYPNIEFFKITFRSIRVNRTKKSEVEFNIKTNFNFRFLKSLLHRLHTEFASI